jgi:hypothetical protein
MLPSQYFWNTSHSVALPSSATKAIPCIQPIDMRVLLRRDPQPVRD